MDQQSLEQRPLKDLNYRESGKQTDMPLKSCVDGGGKQTDMSLKSCVDGGAQKQKISLQEYRKRVQTSPPERTGISELGRERDEVLECCVEETNNGRHNSLAKLAQQCDGKIS